MNVYDEKIYFFKNIIDNIQIGVSKYKLMNIISINEYNSCLESLEKIINLLNTLNYDNIVNDLQYINNNLSSLIKNYGIYNFDNLIKICLSNQFIENKLSDNELYLKYEVIRKYLHPINYKILTWTDKIVKKTTNNIKPIQKNKIIDDTNIIDANNLECFDLIRTSTNFNLRIYGIKVIIHDYINKKTLVINSVFDDVLMNNLSYKFLIMRKNNLQEYIKENNLQNNELFILNSWNNFYNNISLKDYLIYSNQELFNKYMFIMTQISSLEQKTIDSVVNEFIGSELYNQRNMLIQLLFNNHKQEFQYIAYLLYDLLSNENISNGDSYEQKMIYNSLSWDCKKFFKDAMYKTIEYTTTLSNFDNNKIPLEQQICLLKVGNNVKEKAMQKLKEIKSKSEDSGSKARQYLDGLLKIPFGIYKEEYILNKKDEITTIFKNLKEPLKILDIKNIENNEVNEFINLILDLTNKDDFNNVEIINIITIIESNLKPIYNTIISYIINSSLNNKKKILIYILNSINNIIKKNKLESNKLTSSNNITTIKTTIQEFINTYKSNIVIVKEILLILDSINNNNIYNYLINIEKFIMKINSKNEEIIDYIKSFNNVLDSAVHGHNNAKTQIERIIGQWINGEKSGYCFGFEGPPGIGKTSLAKKGIANCLKDINGDSRPFALIALGGSSNGSTIDGHNYTYVGSTWGKIVDILIEKKCMNPIIFIDELDKVSRTEHGKEIIGILTHLIDSTQNDSFQDKYFSNIDLDLSKALFIFSYNDAELIDKILLDRIHRIKFDNLLLDDKLIITEDYLLPELYKKFRLENVINISKELTQFIIENYTIEPGVRKLKEILFEIISSINLDLLKKTNKYNIPVIITREIIEEILHERQQVKYLKINKIPKVGIINGMWANAYGNGGILHIEAKFFSTSTFLELKLTGMQGDVMKESMSVAKTLALSLVNQNTMKKLVKEFEETKMQGIHIHVPEGATPKDGPSAGAAITLVLYSLLTNKKIKNVCAITGETCLQGNITAIGGLDLKILGGIRAGIKTFLYPKDNAKDFKLFCEKHSKNLDGLEFFEVEHISEAQKYMLL
tara:strand:+ start:2380 stop:5613 length:3234 start_codon:yes stop_codon:yes gene_type:complete